MVTTRKEALGRSAGTKPAAPRGTWVRSAWFLLFGAVAAQLGCAGAVSHQRMIGYVEPPRDEVQQSLAQDRIQTADVLTLKLPGDNTAKVSQAYEVSPDGTIELAGYGTIEVAGKTLQEAQQAVYETVAVTKEVKETIELARSEYYLVTVDAQGERHLNRVPLKGAVKVKEALQGMPGLANHLIWVARPTGGPGGRDRVLPVDWESVAAGTDDLTNHELRPGDFLIVSREPAAGLGRVFNAVTGAFSVPGSPPPATHSPPGGTLPGQVTQPHRDFAAERG